jgi:WD40 repeat protein
VFPHHVPIPPLKPPAIAEIVGLYVPAHTVEEGVAAVVDAAGVPLRVHAAASRYGERLAAEQIEVAAAGISAPRRHLSQSQERVTESVLDLQRIRLLRDAHTPDAAATPRLVCPYKGLACFDVEDAPYFFGRERLVAQLVARLVDARLLAVVGASGSGKSSVVRAGLVAALRAGVLPGSEQWRTVLTTPARPLSEPAVDGAARTVLVVDQFEELFTALSPDQRQRYATWLAGAAGRDDVTVVVVVRSDYYAHAAAYPGVRDLLAANTVLVGEMASEEVRQAVELPAAAAGLELEPGLAETLASAVAGEPGGLPLLSTALLSLWEQRDGRRLTHAAYHAMGGVRTAVARLAETEYGQLAPTQQSVARRILLRLADTGEAGDPVRRRVPIAEVAPDGDSDARAVLDALAGRRLLTVSETHAEVAHEALLRAWPRLRGWLDEDEVGRTLRRHLAPAARDWQARGREPSELYRGPRLAAALNWQRDHPDDLTEAEHDFLRVSSQAADAEAVGRRRSIRRLRGLAVGLAGVLVLAVVVGLVALDQRNDASRASFAADVRALQASALDENRWDRALLYAAQAQRFAASEESRAALLQTVQRGPEATAIFGADKPLHSMAVSADGATLVASGINGALYIWDTETRSRVASVPDVTGFMAETLDISPDGRYVAAVGVPVSLHAQKTYAFRVVLVDVEQTPPTVRYLESGEVSAARFTADGRTLMALGDDGHIRYVDVRTGTVQRTLEYEIAEPEVGALTMADNRRYVAAVYPNDGSVVAWEVETGRQLWSSDEPDAAVAAISQDGARLVIGYVDGRLEQVDLATGGDRTPAAFPLTDGLIDVVWSPDGSTFAGATQERTVLVWDAESLQVDAVLRGHWGNLSQAVYSPDGGTVYAAGLDRSVLAWDLTGTEGIVTDIGPRPAPGVQLVGLAADGSVASAAYPDGRVDVFDVDTGETSRVTVAGTPDVLNVDRMGRSVLIHVPPAGLGAAIPGPVIVHAFDTRRGRLLPHTLALDARTAWDAVVTWDGRAVLAAAQRNVVLYDLTTGAPLRADLFEANDAVGAIGMHPGGRLAALAVEGGSIEVIDLTSGRLVETLDPDDQFRERLPFSQLAFSPDGRWLAAATYGGQIIVWDARAWRQHSTREAVAGFSVGSLGFTPDSELLIAGGAGTASIWSVEQPASGGVRLDVDPLRPETNVRVGTRDGGRTIVTFSEGTAVRAWDIVPERLLEHACTIAGRNLTRLEWDRVLPHRPYERTCSQYPDPDEDPNGLR